MTLVYLDDVEYKDITPYAMMAQLNSLGNPHICFTGEEPLTQYRELNGLLTRLNKHKINGKFVYTHIETTGVIVPGVNFAYIDYWSIVVNTATDTSKVVRLLNKVNRDAWIIFPINSEIEVMGIPKFMKYLAPDIVAVVEPRGDLEWVIEMCAKHLGKIEYRVIPALDPRTKNSYDYLSRNGACK